MNSFILSSLFVLTLVMLSSRLIYEIGNLVYLSTRVPSFLSFSLLFQIFFPLSRRVLLHIDEGFKEQLHKLKNQDKLFNIFQNVAKVNSVLFANEVSYYTNLKTSLERTTRLKFFRFFPIRGYLEISSLISFKPFKKAVYEIFRKVLNRILGLDEPLRLIIKTNGREDYKYIISALQYSFACLIAETGEHSGLIGTVLRFFPFFMSINFMDDLGRLAEYEAFKNYLQAVNAFQVISSEEIEKIVCFEKSREALELNQAAFSIVFRESVLKNLNSKKNNLLFFLDKESEVELNHLYPSILDAIKDYNVIEFHLERSELVELSTSLNTNTPKFAYDSFGIRGLDSLKLDKICKLEQCGLNTYEGIEKLYESFPMYKAEVYTIVSLVKRNIIRAQDGICSLVSILSARHIKIENVLKGIGEFLFNEFFEYFEITIDLSVSLPQLYAIFVDKLCYRKFCFYKSTFLTIKCMDYAGLSQTGACIIIDLLINGKLSSLLRDTCSKNIHVFLVFDSNNIVELGGTKQQQLETVENRLLPRFGYEFQEFEAKLLSSTYAKLDQVLVFRNYDKAYLCMQLITRISTILNQIEYLKTNNILISIDVNGIKRFVEYSSLSTMNNELFLRDSINKILEFIHALIDEDYFIYSHSYTLTFSDTTENFAIH